MSFKILTFSLLFLISAPSMALDKYTHRLVCQLAFQNLQPQEQTAINTLLTTIPTQHKKLINQYNARKSASNITFADACTWADAIKNSTFSSNLAKQYSTSHYLNIARTTTKITQSDINKNCKNGCVVNAINQHYQQVTTLNNGWPKTQALLLLGHWLGDIHQPLHVSFASDRGGNQTKIKYNGKCKTLHWFWDSCLLKNTPQQNKADIAILQSLWVNIPMNDEKFTLKEKILVWANESFHITKQQNVQYCEKTTQGCTKFKKLLHINNNYIEKNLPIYYLQLAKASKRLHNLLQHIARKNILQA